jgi:glycosyltransferase involved in cell wall biosynthesis
MPVSVVCLNSAEHDETLANGVRSLGLRLYREHGQLEVLRLLSRLRPTHVVLAAPIPAVVAWAIATRRRLLPIFADSFDTRRPGARLRHWVLSRLLRSSSISIVANHNVNASRGLVRLGVPASKVVPWDWPPQHTPYGVAPKSGRAQSDAVRALFVGSVTEDKGVGDAIDAVASLRARGLDARLTVIGQGRDSSALESRARALGLRDVVEFRGRTSHEEALEAMRWHDVVLVPSRHSYPEGLPMTIYEAFCSRTPLVVSDHPMFRGMVENLETGMVARASDPEDLARCISELAHSEDLYRRISAASVGAWERLQCPVQWGALVERFLARGDDEGSFLERFSLASPRYGFLKK